MAIRGGKDGYIAKFLLGKNYYIAIFPGEILLYSHFSGGMARGKKLLYNNGSKSGYEFYASLRKLKKSEIQRRNNKS